MGNCCGKESYKSSPSNSFTNLKIPGQNEQKLSGKITGGRSRHRSGDSNKETKNNRGHAINPTYTQKSSTTCNGDAQNNPSKHISHRSNDRTNFSHEQPSPASARPDPVGEEDGRVSSYRLRQADLGGNAESSSMDRSTPTSQLTNDRAGSLRLEQQLIVGHRRTGSSDLTKKIHLPSNAPHGGRERSDSQKRIPVDFIRKGSWTVSEPKLTRGDSSDKKDYNPVSAQRPGQGPVLQIPSQPSILVDHCVDRSSLANENSVQKSSIPPPTSPSMTRSDSCKNELNPVLRNKPHLQERRQVVSAMTIDTGMSDTNSNHRLSDLALTAAPIAGRPDQHLACVLKWKKGNLIGRGTFGKVYSAVTEDGQIVAVKQIQLDTTNWKIAEADYKLIQREVHIQKTLDHPNIVKFLDCGLDVADYTINIVMEHVSGGTISSLLKKFGTFDEQVFRRYTSQLIDAVTYLHSNNVVHRDIKGSNIMVTQAGFIKLIDFGTAKKTTDDLVTPLSAMKLDFCIKGTPYWMAPEVVQMAGEPTNKADVWSIGCTVIEMATGSPPYFHMQPMSALFIIGSTNKPSPKLPDNFSEAARDFVSRTLIKSAAQRPMASELGRHRFMLPEFIKQYKDNRGFYI